MQAVRCGSCALLCGCTMQAAHSLQALHVVAAHMMHAAHSLSRRAYGRTLDDLLRAWLPNVVAHAACHT
eukprot:7687194-Alexandrium_andersonii.AAC.1